MYGSIQREEIDSGMQCVGLRKFIHFIYISSSFFPRLFDYTDCPEGPVLPGAHSIERYLIEEHLHNIIKEFHLERKHW